MTDGIRFLICACIASGVATTTCDISTHVLKPDINALRYNQSHEAQSLPLNSSCEYYEISCSHDDEVVSPLWDQPFMLCCDGDKWTSERRSEDGYVSMVVKPEELLCVYECNSLGQTGHARMTSPILGDPGTPTMLTQRELEILKPSIYQNAETIIKYKPGKSFHIICDAGYEIFSSQTRINTECTASGVWIPPPPASCVLEGTSASLGVGGYRLSSDSVTVIIVCAVVGLLLAIILVVVVLRVKRRLVCHKRPVGSGDSADESDGCPLGYTQFDSETEPPSYHDAIREDEQSSYHTLRSSHNYRMRAYSPIASRDSSSREYSTSSRADSRETDSTHRHSLHGRVTGYTDSVSLYHGDHLSMSDTSTLVTVNTYESGTPTASNPSLNNLRRPNNGSVTGTDSLDETPLIPRSDEPDIDVEVEQSCARSLA